jgi:transposase
MGEESLRYPEIKRFDEVPGVGLIGACRFAAYVQTPHRFSSTRKLRRYCRLGITDRSSDGQALGRRRLDRNGVGRLKFMSQQAFGGAMKTKKDNMFKRFFRASLHRTQDSTHARLSTQRKILAVLHAMWLSGGRYDDSKG